MAKKEDSLYTIYKPLRNYLRQFWVENALYVIWAYVTHFQFKTPFPKDIEVDQSILTAKSVPERGVYEWELALLAREIILHGVDSIGDKKKDINFWINFSNAINKVKDFEGNAWPVFGDQKNIMKEFRRIAHKQFPWQSKPTSAQFVRYFKIYSNHRLKDIIQTSLGLNIQQWYTLGTAILGSVLSNPKMNVDPEISIAGLTNKEFDVFLSHTSLGIAELREIIKEKVKLDDEFLYTLNPLEYYPLVKIGQYYYCPLITFLVWRITSGLYFNLIKNKDFGHAFGLAFQDYLEEVANKVLDKKTKVLGEQKYKDGKNEKDSVDIILHQDQASFFVEAKAKRMQLKSKSQILSDEAIEKDLEILAEDVVQVYVSIEDYKKNLYPHFPYLANHKIYPLIVTLEEWYLLGEDTINLKNKVVRKLKEKGLSENLVEEIPFTLCATEKFECLLQVLNSHTIEEVLLAWFPLQKAGHDFGNYLLTTYKGECKYVDHFFPDDFEKIYPPGVMKKEA